MSSKNDRDPPASARRGFSPPRAWSLSARLTAWYAGSAFAVVLAATGFFYWSSVRNLDRQDDRLLGDRARVLQSVLATQHGNIPAISHEVEEEWDAHQRAEIHVRILDDAGQVLVQTPGIRALLPSSTFPAPTADPAQGTNALALTGATFRVLSVQATAGSPERSYVIQVGLDRSLEMELHAENRRNLLWVLSVAVVVCSLVGYAIAHRGMRPIHAMTETAHRIRPTNLGERMAADGMPGELLALAATFNQMLDRLEQSFARLARFSADIAHELRTPVYNLRGEIEVALSKPRAPEEYRDVLSSSLEECGRLERLIDRLLFLARAENPETQIVREPCDVRTELETVSEFYEAAAAEVGVRLAVAVPEPISANLDRPLFQRAIGNLVANAVAHTPPGGSVTVSAVGEPSLTRIEVSDTGCGIAADHLPHVFDRFYRADGARSSRSGNVGLGLAIVRSIVELHGGTVQIASSVGKGTRITMSFPSVTQ